MSQHELRIQRSLQKLDVPEWYKSNARKPLGGTDLLSRRRATANGGAAAGWAGTTTSSMTSLGSLAGYSSRSGTPTRVVIPTRVRPDWRNVKSSKESLLSPADSNAAAPSSSSQFARWGSARSYTSSGCPSPSPSSISTASYRPSLLSQHGRQPYLGWRSQEKLNQQQSGGGSYPTPAERLASTVAGRKASEQQPSDGVDEQIRQVTSAIVHYVKDGASPRTGAHPERHPLEALSRSPSPRRQQRCVWVESSFIGGPDRLQLNHHGNNSTCSSSSTPSPTPAFRPESPVKTRQQQQQQQTSNNHRAKGELMPVA